MAADVLIFGLLAGIIHFVALGVLYQNPWIARMYASHLTNPAVRRWSSQPRYLITQLLGTQVEVYLIAAGFVWLRPLVPADGLGGALLIGSLFAGLRAYPRFWNTWIQTTYPTRLTAIELVNGLVGTYVIILSLHLLL